MSVGWHPDTIVGTIGRLDHETLPDFDGVTYDVFAKAGSAIIKAGFLKELQSLLAKEAIAFVEAGKDQPQALVPICEAALQARIGTCIRSIWIPLSALDDQQDSFDLFKRIKIFLPKSGKQPDWYTEWKVVMEKREKEKEAAAAQKKLVVKAMKLKDAEAKKQAVAIDDAAKRPVPDGEVKPEDAVDEDAVEEKKTDENSGGKNTNDRKHITP